MIFKIGRSNFALTVMVPYNCENNCAFCTAKEMYHRVGTNVEDVKFQIGKTLGSCIYPIKDVVFTGGEPTTDLDVLRELIDLVPADKNVYINTTLPARKFDEFHDLVNDEPKIKGINISRHTPSIKEDRQFYDFSQPDWKSDNEVVGDEALRLINKPIRINCVLTDEYEQDWKKIVDRWASVRKDVNPNISLCFRENFAALTLDAKVLQRENLHNPYTSFLVELAKEYLFIDHTQCNVCDTTRFMTPGGLVVAYHRGLEKSSILSPDGKTLEINDLVIFPNGEIGYDWKEISLKTMYECEMYFLSTAKPVNPLRDLFNSNMSPSFDHLYPETRSSCGGGGSGCGGPVYFCGENGLPTCGGVRRCG